MAERGGSRVHERWARLRFSIIGALLAAPPAKGALRAALQQLAAREWRHPSTGAPVRFGVSTLERWFYRSRNEQHDPVSVLRRKRRQDAGEQASMTPPLRQALLAQYNAHKSWSAQLHRDNIVALAEIRSELRPVPSYATVRRFLAARGLTRRRPMTTRQTEGALAAEARLEAREVRSYEAAFVNGTWHWDCHVGSRKVLTPRGEWRTPILFGVLDDRSRLACRSAVVSVRICGEHSPRFVAGDAEAGPAARRDERQRRRDDSNRDHRRSRQTRHPSPDHVAVQPVYERQATTSARGCSTGQARRRCRPDCCCCCCTPVRCRHGVALCWPSSPPRWASVPRPSFPWRQNRGSRQAGEWSDTCDLLPPEAAPTERWVDSSCEQSGACPPRFRRLASHREDCPGRRSGQESPQIIGVRPGCPVIQATTAGGQTIVQELLPSTEQW